LAAFVAAASQVPTLVSVERTRASDDALDRGDLPQAAELADEAIRAEPWASSPYAQRALVAEAERDLSQARRFARQAVDRGPNDWRPLLVLARIDARARDQQAVLADVARARELAPRSPYLVAGAPFLQRLAALYRETRRPK
jgi:Tfp pilus assembly protein PilF